MTLQYFILPTLSDDDQIGDRERKIYNATSSRFKFWLNWFVFTRIEDLKWSEVKFSNELKS